MAKRKMNQDLMKSILLGIIIIGILHILILLFYKFIGFNLWNIFKIGNERCLRL